MKTVQINMLLYGDFPDLHSRLLKSLEMFPPVSPHIAPEHIFYNIWANTIGERSKILLSGFMHRRAPNGTVYFSDDNLPKYKAMSNLFLNSRLRDEEIEPNKSWAIWFDDDSFVTASDWFDKVLALAETDNRISYIGQKWFVHYLPGQEDFVKASPWYKNVAVELIQGKPGVHFATGAYWWLRLDLLRKINWPDPRLSHNGGDTLLGEACRQNGCPVKHFDYGVQVNKAARRGLSETPAGSTVEARR